MRNRHNVADASVADSVRPSDSVTLIGGEAYLHEGWLDVARAMEQSLAARGHTAVLTRDADRNVPLHERLAMSSDLGARVYVALHADGTRQGGPAVLIHPQASPPSRALARAAQGHHTGQHDRHVPELFHCSVSRGITWRQVTGLQGGMNSPEG